MHVKAKNKKKGRYRLLPNGGSGVCGSLYPTCSLLTSFTMLFKRNRAFWSLKNGSKKALKLLGKEGEWRRGMVDGSWVLLMAQSLIFWQYLPLFFLWPAKNQQVNKIKRWWYAQKSNKYFKGLVLTKIWKIYLV